MLRKLQPKDADGMLEWIKDPDINCFFQFNADSRNRQNVLEFIIHAEDDRNCRHFAIVDEKDEYLGTVSLKNINPRNENAEYAISLRKKAIGTGVARQATLELFHIAFKELNLQKVYLNVFQENLRAINFYIKMGFQYEGTFIKHIKAHGEYKNLSWYAYLRENEDGQG